MTRSKIHFPRKPSYYPSEASAIWIDAGGQKRVAGTCMRASWLRVTEKAKEYVLLSDPHTEWIFALGKAVEQILVEQYKEMGIWVANNVEFYDPVRKISGEVDVIINEPGTDKLVGVEVKSFFGYNATKEICGNKGQVGSPKTSQLLQTLVYVDQLKDKIAYFKMIYYARDSAKRKEFNITLTKDGSIRRPTVDGIVDHRFTMEDIYSRYDELDWYVQNDAMPAMDFEPILSTETVEMRKSIGEVSKTAYDKWKKNPKKYPIMSWQCSYCRYKQVCAKLSGNTDLITSIEDDEEEE